MDYATTLNTINRLCVATMARAKTMRDAEEENAHKTAKKPKILEKKAAANENPLALLDKSVVGLVMECLDAKSLFCFAWTNQQIKAALPAEMTRRKTRIAEIQTECHDILRSTATGVPIQLRAAQLHEEASRLVGCDLENKTQESEYPFAKERRLLKSPTNPSCHADQRLMLPDIFYATLLADIRLPGVVAEESTPADMDLMNTLVREMLILYGSEFDIDYFRRSPAVPVLPVHPDGPETCTLTVPFLAWLHGEINDRVVRPGLQNAFRVAARHFVVLRNPIAYHVLLIAVTLADGMTAHPEEGRNEQQEN